MRRPTGVLVIDDETMLLELATDTLAASDMRIFTAGDGAQGIQMFRRHRDDIGVILPDMTMPGMSGAECFRAIRRTDAGARILIFSGHSHAELEDSLPGLEPTACIPKPFRPDQLADMVRSGCRS